MRGIIAPLACSVGVAFVILSVSSHARSQPAPTGRSLPSLPGRMDAKVSSAPQLISHFSFAGGSLEDRIPPPANVPKRVATLGVGGALDPDTRSFLKADGRGEKKGKVANLNRAAELVLPEYSVSVFYFIEYLYGSTGTCSWQRILWHKTADIEFNQCNYPRPYLRGGPVKYSPEGSAPFLTPKKWHHVALTRSTTETKLYFNGGLVGTAPSAPLPSYLPEEPFSVGTWLYGAIDELRFYKGVVDAATIASLAQAGPSIEKPTASSLSPTAPLLVK